MLGPSKPRKSLNLKLWIPGLESPGIFVEVLESPGIWTYRSIFLIISVQEFNHYTSSEIWVYLCTLKVCEFIEMVLEFDIERSWKVLESKMSKCVWTLCIIITNKLIILKFKKIHTPFSVTTASILTLAPLCDSQTLAQEWFRWLPSANWCLAFGASYSR